MIRVIDGFLKNVRDFEMEATAQTLRLAFCDNMEYPGYDNVTDMLNHCSKDYYRELYAPDINIDIYNKAWDKAVEKCIFEEKKHIHDDIAAVVSAWKADIDIDLINYYDNYIGGLWDSDGDDYYPAIYHIISKLMQCSTKEAEAVYYIYDRLFCNLNGIAKDFRHDYISITEKGDNTYAWYSDENNDIAMNVNTQEWVENTEVLV